MTASVSPEPAVSPKPSVGLFRQKALAKLSSPEHLDQLVRIVPPLGWLSLVALLAVISGALLWSFIGRVPTTVNGQGILLRGGKISTISSQGSGQLATLSVKIGDLIRNGQEIGTISQPVLISQIANQQRTIENRRQYRDKVKEDAQKALASRAESFNGQRASAEASISDYQQQLEALQKVVSAQEKLLAGGLIPMTTLLQSRTQLNAAQLNILSAKNQLQQIGSSELNSQFTSQKNVYEAETNLQTEIGTLNELQAQMNQTSAIVSTLEGRLVGISAALGQDVAPGTQILELEENNQAMIAVLYFPAGQGKKVLTGMTAQISPATAPVDKFGFIVGRVTRVADVPATEGSIMGVLSNKTLVTSITAGGAPLEVDATLETNESTVSHFKWSSSRGPSTTVSGGTMCTARVIVSEERPIDLVIPLLKDLFGVAN